LARLTLSQAQLDVEIDGAKRTFGSALSDLIKQAEQECARFGNPGNPGPTWHA
jgi:hypothetical protein